MLRKPKFFGQRLEPNSRRIIIALSALILSLVLANYSRFNESTALVADGRVTPKGTLVFGALGQPTSLSPGDISDGHSLYVQQQIYNYLVGNESGSTELRPELARQWDVSDNDLTWTFYLRDDVEFHDGTRLDAEAVVFNVMRWWDPEFAYGYRNESTSYGIWANLFGGFKGDRDSTVVEVKAIDELTVVFRLAQPFSAFPAAISSAYFGIASPTAIKAAGENYGQPDSKIAGTGPFLIKEWASGEHIILSKFKDYWEEALPESQNLVRSFVEDPTVRLEQLKSGILHFTVDLAPKHVSEIESNPDLQTVFRPSFNVGYLALNPTYEPLASQKVRQAIARAINKSAIVEKFWGELGETDGHFLPPSLDHYRSEKVTDYNYNVAAAKAALSEAGYPNGFDMDLWYMSVSRPYFPTPKPIAEAFAAELSKVGIKVTLRTEEWSQYLRDRNVAPGYHAFILGWTGDYGDPDNFLYSRFGPGGTADLGNYQNSELIDLLNKARITNEKEERVALYKKADEIIFAEALRIPIVHSQPLLGERVGMEGWHPSPFSSEPLSTLSNH